MRPSIARQCIKRGSRPRPIQQQRPLQSRVFPPALFAAVAVGSISYYLFSSPAPPTVLNKERFVAYDLTSRTAISPTSFILEVSPRNPANASTYLEGEASSKWRFPQWSVEFKQPEVQIARHYTPLPPLSDAEAREGVLRFYVRTIPGGEMSSYLGRLGPGSEIWVRGPHAGFDVAGRLGARGKKVVFLAGGTGIVPGMQVARAVLDSDKSATVSLFWAVRKREELQSAAKSEGLSWWTKPSLLDVKDDMDKPSPVGRELQILKKAYGERLEIKVAVDEEKTAIDQKTVQSALATTTTSTRDDAPECRLHSQRMLQMAPEFEEQGHDCACGPEAGRHLLIVSGPVGFVSRLAGPKAWVQGIETQGVVGGIVGQVMKSNAGLARDWLVLKL